MGRACASTADKPIRPASAGYAANPLPAPDHSPALSSAGNATLSGGTTDAAQAALEAGLLADHAYFNVHTSVNPGGEIRGDIAPVPEPSTLALVGLGAAALLVLVRRRSA